jgi:hypothetical protein
MSTSVLRARATVRYTVRGRQYQGRTTGRGGRMDARLYVYAYLLLSALYVAACLQYLTSVGRTAALARALQPSIDEEPAPLDSEAALEEARTSLRAVLGVDSAAFACAVLPVAYVGVSGLLANILSRNTSAAAPINVMWLLATMGLVAAHMFFVVRIIGQNTRLKEIERPVLTRSFVSRQTNLLTYYRGFVLLVTAFNVVNALYTLANISTIVRLPFVI